MRNYLLIFFIVFGIIESPAQQIWKRALCVTLQGDTLGGQILFEDWDVSPSQVTFRDSIKQEQTKFGLDKLKSFVLGDHKAETFEAKKVRITKFSDAPVAQGNQLFSVDTVSRFIELKFRSKVISLYLLYDDDKVKHYYIMKDSIITELQYGSAVLIRNGKSLTYTNNEYKNQLKKLLEECPTLDVSGITYSDKSLIKLLTEYHSFCKVEYRIMFESEAKTAIDVGLGGGTSLPLAAGFYNFDLTTRFLLPKRFHNRFVLVKVGIIVSDNIERFTNKPDVVKHYLWQFGVYAGTYFGNEKRALLPFAYGGLSKLIGLNVGVGLSIRKRFDLSLQTKIGRDAIVGVEAKFYPFFRKATGY